MNTNTKRNIFIDDEAVEDRIESAEDDLDVEALEDLINDAELTDDDDVGVSLPYIRFDNDRRKEDGVGDENEDTIAIRENAADAMDLAILGGSPSSLADGLEEGGEEIRRAGAVQETPLESSMQVATTSTTRSRDDRHIYNESRTKLIACAPTLFIVKCLEGHEYYVIYKLMRKLMNVEKPCIYTATIRDDIPGHVFLETPYDNMLGPCITLLQSIRAVKAVYPWEAVSVRKVRPACTVSLFREMPHAELETVGTWTRFRMFKKKKRSAPEHIYQGDVALIVNVVYPEMDVVFVPRIPRSALKDGGTNLIHLADHIQMMYDPDKLNEMARDEIAKKYSHENGLRIRRVHALNLWPAADSRMVTQDDILPFIHSGHRAVVRHFPVVKEWKFEVGEVVERIWKRQESRPIVQITERGVWVDAGRENLDLWGWGVIKIWSLADFATCSDGTAGFVFETQGDWIGIIPATSHVSECLANITYRHRNSALPREPDHFFGTIRPQIELPVNAHVPITVDDATLPVDIDVREKAVANPWKGMTVVVTSGSHKGEHTVLDLIPGEKTSSGYKVVLRSCIVHKPTESTVDYNDVVCLKTGLPLHRSAFSRAWRWDFPEGFTHRHEYVKYQAPKQIRIPPEPSQRASTPIPEDRHPVRRQRHESQKWLMELDTVDLTFEMDIVGDDGKLKRVKLTVADGLDENLFSERVLYYEVRKKRVFVEATTEVKPVKPSSLSRRPFIIYNDDNVLPTDLSEMGKVYTKIGFMNCMLYCAAVDTTTWSIDTNKTYVIDTERACMMYIRGKADEERFMKLAQVERDKYAT